MKARRNPHDGRAAELYKRENGELIWIGYTGVPLFETASWNSELQAWVLHGGVLPVVPPSASNPAK